MTLLLKFVCLYHMGIETLKLALRKDVTYGFFLIQHKTIKSISKIRLITSRI